ncbi:hypothetical protein OUY22_11185 [Nonomuraea sp. MCN248]|uniref:Tetratricopeptide repeat protein n=1 Tax=Nonomuraea corallina TaxID=2989783 RepID=A0ABT4S9U5_9ACTN|nr:hypothetical protein [Nonomuraea corallina]MDA0633981.1 hypothetical protein [Nonomuraea corallina]
MAPLREAVAALERYAPGDPVLAGHLARAMLMLGEALMATGRAPEASAVLHRGTRVIRDGHLSALAHYRLGLCELRLGRDEAADAALRTADGTLRELLGERDSGHDRGHDRGHEPGYDRGYDRGHDRGHEPGYDSGYDSERDTGYDTGHGGRRHGERDGGHESGRGGEDDEELVEMHRDVLRARLALNERAGRAGEVASVQHDLVHLRWFQLR